MLQTEILISALTVIIAQGLSINNLVKRGRFTLNRIFSILAFAFSLLFLIQFLQLIDFKFVSGTTSARIYFSLIMFISQLLFHIFQIYPDEALIPKLKYIILASLPSIIMISLTLFTEQVISYASFVGYLDFQFGNLFPVFRVVMAFNLFGSLVQIIYKSKYTIPSRVLRQELRYISYGLIIVVLMLMILVFFMPGVLKINLFRNLGITVPGIFILIIMNYAVFDIRVIDFKIFNIKLVFWLLVFFILYIPVLALVVFSGKIFSNDDVNIVVLSVVSFIYLVGFYRFGKPKLEAIFRRGYLKLEKNFEEFFRSISQLTVADRHGPLWDEFYKKAIDEFIERFEITGAYFYLLDKNSGDFVQVHSAGKEMERTNLDGNSIVMKNLRNYAKLLDRSIIYSDVQFASDRDALIEFYDRYKIDIIIPFFLPSGDMVGLLFLGYLAGDKLYTKTFLAALDIYRIQFQRILVNGLILEDVRVDQIVVHDKMVIGSIKRRIIPREMNYIEGIRVSSFYMNSSSFGGDYFDSIKIGSDKLGIIISDSAYYGVESAILSLELFSAFHSRPRKIETTDKIVSVLNWVINTSRFTKKYAPAFLMIYSSIGEIQYTNAGYNPLMLYNPSDNAFTFHSTKGIPIGVEKDYKYEAKTSKVEPGTIGVLYSNGFITAINEKGETYSIDRVKDVIRKNRYETASIITRRIYQDFEEFISSKKQNNDVSFILFKV